MRKIFESIGLVKSLGLVGLIATAPIVYAGTGVFGNSTMTLVPSDTKFDTATPLSFDLSGAPCSIFGSDAEAIQNGGCSVDLSNPAAHPPTRAGRKKRSATSQRRSRPV